MPSRTGAKIGGVRTGTFGDLAAFSFYPTKNLGAFGDGGAGGDERHRLAARLESLREYGWRDRYVSTFPGVNSRLDETAGSHSRVKLERLDADNERRRRDRRPRIRPPWRASGAGGLPSVRTAMSSTSFINIVIRTADRDDCRRSSQQRGSARRSIIRSRFIGSPRMRIAGRLLAFAPRTEKLCSEILSLPMFPQSTDAGRGSGHPAIEAWSINGVHKGCRGERCGRIKRRKLAASPQTNACEHFVTLFDASFLPIGLALYESLVAHAGPFRLWVVAIDDAVEKHLAQLALPDLTVIPLRDIGNARAAGRETRSHSRRILLDDDPVHGPGRLQSRSLGPAGDLCRRRRVFSGRPPDSARRTRPVGKARPHDRACVRP